MHCFWFVEGFVFANTDVARCMESPRRRGLRQAKDRQEQLARGVSVVQHGVSALMQLAHMMDEEFVLAADKIASMRGNLIVCGIGKAGLIGRKIAATFSSTGTRSHFLHPSEALHGDLGCIGPNDVMLVLSNSGATPEIVELLPHLSRRASSVIAITSKINSPLAQASDITLVIPNCPEACRLNLAPTTSTLAMLALGDALAILVSENKEFGQEDFARLHPGGALGLRLASVDELMRPLEECRVCNQNTTLRHMLVETARPGRRTGAVMVENDQHALVGIFTDSDLTRFLGKHQSADLDCPLHEVMTRKFSAICSGAKLSEAIEILSSRKISELPVVNHFDQPIGLIDITDLIGLEPLVGTMEPVASSASIRIFGSTL
jgi:arabinose-5-phosphate isomerase